MSEALRPPRSFISHSSPDLGEEEAAAVVECIRSQQIKGGGRVADLEQRIASDLGFAGAVAATTGAQAIHLALRAYFEGAPAIIGLPSYVCRSVYDAVCLAGCRPHLLDIDAGHFSLAPGQAAAAPIDAVIVPHMFGIRAPIETYMAMGLPVIEDCAQRLPPPSRARTEPKADVRILSFEATKLLTGGEGGLLLSDDEDLLARARHLRNGAYDSPDPVLWLPLSDLHAALVAVQWGRLPSFLVKRRELTDFYWRRLADVHPERLLPILRQPDTFPFRFLLWEQDVASFLSQAIGLPVAFRRPVAPTPLHALFRVDGDFGVTEQVFAHLLSIPLYPYLTAEEAEVVADCVISIWERSKNDSV